jgi:hypothetical protein
MPVDAPAPTLNYMIAGYLVIFGVMAGYLTSLVLRWRKARQELELMEELEKKPEA